jgi:hypothetical protein
MGIESFPAFELWGGRITLDTGSATD